MTELTVRQKPMTDCALRLSRVSAPGTGNADAVHYGSEGRLLILADAPIEISRDWFEHPELVSVLVQSATGAVEAKYSSPAPHLLFGELVDLCGWLGRFTARFRPSVSVAGRDAREDSDDVVVERFDLVIDLGESPALRMELPPVGYFRADTIDDLDRVLARYRELVGHFSKPRYFRYDVSICAHDSFGVQGCTRCLDVCPADAIVSEGSRIEVNPYLCQGCASCTLACPTGALAFTFPSRDELLHRVAVLLQGEAAAGSTIIFHRQSLNLDPPSMPVPVHCVDVEALSAVGEEIWFAALALGAGRVVLLADPEPASKAFELLSARVSLGRQMLNVCGVDSDALMLVRHVNELPQPGVPKSIEPTIRRDDLDSATAYKRLLSNRALAALGGDSESAACALEPDAPWGRIVIDSDRCTQCSACAEVCPTLAIRYFEDAERAWAEIGFNEQRCVQCGICATSCPTNAIKLEARFAGARGEETWAVASAGEMARCSRCHDAFVPRKMLEFTLDSMRNRGALNDDIEQQLRRCPECRARDVHPD